MMIKRKCAADLEEYANNSKPIRLASSLSKAAIAGVPVYQMQLGGKKTGWKLSQHANNKMAVVGITRNKL